MQPKVPQLLMKQFFSAVRMWDAVQAENVSIYDFHNNPVLACDVRWDEAKI